MSEEDRILLIMRRLFAFDLLETVELSLPLFAIHLLVDDFVALGDLSVHFFAIYIKQLDGIIGKIR